MQLGQHRKVYARFHSPHKNEGAAKKCSRKIREQGKQEIRNQLDDSLNYYFEDWSSDYDDYYDCCDSNPCSSCKTNYLEYLGFDFGGKNPFLYELVGFSPDYIWSYGSGQNYGETYYTITHDKIDINDIKAFVDFHTDHSISLIEWMIHPDAGIRALASRKYAGNRNQ